MSDEQKIEYVKSIIDDTAVSDNLVTVYLEMAKANILSRMFPFGVPEETVFPANYDFIQVQLAARYIQRRGAEGELNHSENGINRSYKSTNDEDLLMEVMQVIV